jgi:hypothetical protein
MSNTKTSPEKATEKVNALPTEKSNSTQPKQVLSNTKVDEIIYPSASSRIKKLENFQILAGKHEFLQTKKNELDKFIISSDGTKEKVVLKNADGFQFEVSASQVVEKVLDVIQSELAGFIEKSEKEILAFNI